MNGVIEITIDKKPYTFRFNVHACMLFQKKALNNSMSELSSEAHIKLMGDLFYCGLYGQSMRTQTEPLNYEAAMDLLDKFSEEDHFMESTAKLWDAWKVSKWGSELVTFGEEIKKKLDEQKKNGS